MIRSEKTRQYIIEKTAAIFNKKGYVGTFLSDLTKATGLTKGSIYGNFKDKNEVAVEAFRHNYRFQAEPIRALLAQQTTAFHKMQLFLNYYKTAYPAIFNNGGCAILNTAVDADYGNDALKQEVILKINAWSHTIVSLLNQAMEEGDLAAINTEAFAYKIIAVIEGSMLLAKTLGSPEILITNITYLEQELNALKKK